MANSVHPDQEHTWADSWDTALFVLRKFILQICMRSHPVGLDVWFLVRPLVYFHTSCEQTAKALARLRECAGSPEPSLVAYVISTIISWTGSIMLCPFLVFFLQKHLAEVNVKFSKFQRPADFEPKLSHVKRELDNIQERIYLLEIRSDDVESLQQKHDTCMVCTVIIPTFRTDRSGQTWTQIRLPLNRGCTVCHSVCTFWMMKK